MKWTSLLWLINKIFPNLSKNVSFLCALKRGILALDKIKDRREGWTDAGSAVGFCLGSGLFGSYNSD